jgi:hypothetical protein
MSVQRSDPENYTAAIRLPPPRSATRVWRRRKVSDRDVNEWLVALRARRPTPSEGGRSISKTRVGVILITYNSMRWLESVLSGSDGGAT